jgi:predicted Rossmann fold nucleotide-binding protein DprA/Smf involved in DNA uptake
VENVSPLTPRLYSLLLESLTERGLTLADISSSSTLDRFEASPLTDVSTGRIKALLAREEAVEPMLRRWDDAGLALLCRTDSGYLKKLITKLEHSAPPFIFCAGGLDALNEPVIAIVGSRNADRDALEFAAEFSATAARVGIVVVSGGARGIDSAAMRGALEEGGRVVGVLAGDLGKSAGSPDNEAMIRSGRLMLMGLRLPETPFTIPSAMERNKVIYALADSAVIVCADDRKGGTWAGAEENGRRGWTPAFVRKEDKGGGTARLLSEGWVRELPSDALQDPLQLLSDSGQNDDAGKPLSLSF